MTRYGFTGSRYLDDKQRNLIFKTLESLNLSEKDIVITGACLGVDCWISHTVKNVYPLVKQEIIVPYDRSLVDLTCYENGVLSFMTEGNYRDRNEEIVNRSDMIIAFWDGRIRSGTYMTINIAKKAGVPVIIKKI